MIHGVVSFPTVGRLRPRSLNRITSTPGKLWPQLSVVRSFCLAARLHTVPAVGFPSAHTQSRHLLTWPSTTEIELTLTRVVVVTSWDHQQQLLGEEQKLRERDIDTFPVARATASGGGQHPVRSDIQGLHVASSSWNMEWNVQVVAERGRGGLKRNKKLFFVSLSLSPTLAPQEVEPTRGISCQFNWIVRDVWLLQWQLVKATRKSSRCENDIAKAEKRRGIQLRQSSTESTSIGDLSLQLLGLSILLPGESHFFILPPYCLRCSYNSLNWRLWRIGTR